MIANLTIGDIIIDCAHPERSRDFYAELSGWEKTQAYGFPALTTAQGLLILFAEPDAPYEAPVWPEQAGKQQKQMHFDFQVDELSSAVAAAVALGAAKTVEQYGGEDFITLLDPEGHPFCLCRR